MAKKAGGTFFGNLLRSAGAAVSTSIGMPGLLGSGKNMIPPANPVPWNLDPNNTASSPVTVTYARPTQLNGGDDDKNKWLMYGGIAIALFLLLKKR